MQILDNSQRFLSFRQALDEVLSRTRLTKLELGENVFGVQISLLVDKIVSGGARNDGLSRKLDLALLQRVGERARRRLVVVERCLALGDLLDAVESILVRVKEVGGGRKLFSGEHL